MSEARIRESEYESIRYQYLPKGFITALFSAFNSCSHILYYFKVSRYQDVDSNAWVAPKPLTILLGECYRPASAYELDQESAFFDLHPEDRININGFVVLGPQGSINQG